MIAESRLLSTAQPPTLASGSLHLEKQRRNNVVTACQLLALLRTSQATTMLVTNDTRRRAILYGFLPLLALAAVLSLKIHVLVPSVTTWPTQREIARQLAAIARHKLWPWTAHSYGHGGLKQETEEEPSGREPFSRHIVAVGDLHGDLPNARKVLKFAGVTDEKGDWSGDVDFFVQTGDIIDR